MDIKTVNCFDDFKHRHSLAESELISKIIKKVLNEYIRSKGIHKGVTE